ncbi:branched-chain alpha-ketoacid dehydrogenase [Crucibulum laeve]|uniref:Protein-serine/threonine kinase n=1 Tax=Crucibulum laeve TaxID=68775 RepID=A0A5C3MDN4_9AGAR|nr:branched-chain alpha-ketoacid dehydrogenase [Crucibulum laeve]
MSCWPNIGTTMFTCKRNGLLFSGRYISPSTTFRRQSTTVQFYQNRQLELYASKEAKPLTLRQLVFFGRSMNEERLIKSANYVRTELPVRIAHRIRDLQALPYVVVTQEGVARVYELYWLAFEKFRRYPPIITLADNNEFCKFLSGILNEHATVIPNLSLGLSLSSPFLLPDQLDSFMRRMLISRISRRVLAEHHIALSDSHAGRSKEHFGEPHVGIIFTGLNVKRSIEKCATLLRERPFWAEDNWDARVKGNGWPDVIIEGHLDTKFAYIREHLEYIIFELLKNSMRATVVKYQGAISLPSIRATIVAGENDVGIRISDQGGGLLSSENQIKTPSDLFSFSHVRNAARMENSRLGALRNASTSEQGVKATVDEQLGRWQQAMLHKIEVENEKTIEAHVREAGEGWHPRIGIGLPMSYIFATYFGGSLELVSLDGWGTDVYLRLPKLGTNLEGIEV